VINAYLQNDDVEKAIDTGENLVDMAPDFALGYNNLAYDRTPQNDLINESFGPPGRAR
jgi:hypothetical protein